MDAYIEIAEQLMGLADVLDELEVCMNESIERKYAAAPVDPAPATPEPAPAVEEP
jgi:hypothetical protein